MIMNCRLFMKKMKHSLIIVFVALTSFLAGQDKVKIDIRQGDHVYILDDTESFPKHYQFEHIMNVEFEDIYNEIAYSKDIKCLIYFDPDNCSSMQIRKSDNDVFVEKITMDNGIIAENAIPETQPRFIDGKIVLNKDKYLWIYTPYLKYATSFQICTNNRVFVFVKEFNNINKMVDL